MSGQPLKLRFQHDAAVKCFGRPFAATEFDLVADRVVMERLKRGGFGFGFNRQLAEFLIIEPTGFLQSAEPDAVHEQGVRHCVVIIPVAGDPHQVTHQFAAVGCDPRGDRRETLVVFFALGAILPTVSQTP